MSRVAVVTGASKGIGRATAVRLAEDFSTVVIISRSSETLAETAASVRAAGSEPVLLGYDLRDPRAPAAVIADTLARAGRIDAIACIAGAVPQADLFSLSDEQWDEGFALKFHSARRLTIHAWDALKRSGGSVAFTSGATAQVPKASFAAVGTINAAIVALAKTFADRGLGDGVQVNSILPGAVMTDRRRAMLQVYANNHQLTLDDAVVRFAADAGIVRYGEPADIANAIAFLFEPRSRWITGTAFRVDGGETRAV